MAAAVVHSDSQAEKILFKPVDGESRRNGTLHEIGRRNAGSTVIASNPFAENLEHQHCHAERRERDQPRAEKAPAQSTKFRIDQKAVMNPRM